MIIRNFKSSDTEKCVTAYIESYNCAPWNYNWTYPYAHKYLLDYILAPRFEGFVVELEGKIVAVLFGQGRTWLTSEQFYIDELYVIPQMRGQGIGTTLLEHVERHCKENKFSLLYLMTSRNTDGPIFYSNKYFSQSENWLIYYKDL